MGCVVVIPHFLSDGLERELAISCNLLQEEGLYLVEWWFNLIVVLIGALKVALWVLVDHVVEMIIISEKGVNWAENVPRGDEPWEGPWGKRKDKGAKKRS